MDTQPEFDLVQEFSLLTPQQQQEALCFVRELRSSSGQILPAQADQTPVARKDSLRELAASIPTQDINRMKCAIAADCERVDADGW